MAIRRAIRVELNQIASIVLAHKNSSQKEIRNKETVNTLTYYEIIVTFMYVVKLVLQMDLSVYFNSFCIIILL